MIWLGHAKTWFLFSLTIKRQRRKVIDRTSTKTIGGQDVTWYGLTPFCGVETNQPLLLVQVSTIALLHDMAWHGVAWRGIA